MRNARNLPTACNPHIHIEYIISKAVALLISTDIAASKITPECGKGRHMHPSTVVAKIESSTNILKARGGCHGRIVINF